MNRKQIKNAGIITYSILLLLALYLYKERAFFVDIAYHTFFIIKNSSWAIQNNRFGAMATQALPLLALKAGLSLKAVVVCYSASFILFYAAVFLFLLRVLKDERMALVMLLFNTAMVAHTFYWIQSELPQACAFALLYLATVYRMVTGKTTVPVMAASLVLLVTACFTHPLIIFVLVFGLLFIAVNERKPLFPLLHLVAAVIIYWVKSSFFGSAYDSKAIQGAGNMLQLARTYFHIPALHNFVHYLIHDYYFLTLLTIAVGCVYLVRREYIKLILVTGFFLGYSFIVNISYPYGCSQFYAENQYLVLALFVLIPFVFDVLPLILRPALRTGVVACILGISLIRIYDTHHLYTARVKWYRDLLQQTAALPQNKLIVSARIAPMDKMLMLWSSSFECWLLSTVETGKTRTVLFEEQPGQFDDALQLNRSFRTQWETFDYDSLDKRYFNFTDTATYYVRYP